MMRTMPIAPRAMMVVTAPIVGIVTGIILGLFAWMATKLMRRPVVATAG